MSINPRFGFAVANVKDVAKAKRFYSEVLGLKVQREAPTFIQFENFEAKFFGKVFSTHDPDGGERFVLELSAARPSKAV